MLAVGFAAVGRAEFILTITPTFDASIGGDPNAIAIEAIINSVIGYYESAFTTHFASVNVAIQFHEMASGLGASTTGIYNVGYNTARTVLGNASSGDATDTTALAHLPAGSINPVNGNANLLVASANGRALGLSTPAAVTVGAGTFDGSVGLNTSITTPGSPGTSLTYSLFAVTEHEIDEVLGLGSDVGGTGFFADPRIEDLYRYASGGARNYTAAGDNAFFSLDGITDLVQFNQTGGGADYGDWHASATPRVQDAFATGGANSTLANDGGAEVIALDAIGYNLAVTAVPEPSTVVLFGTALVGIAVLWRLPKRRFVGSIKRVPLPKV